MATIIVATVLILFVLAAVCYRVAFGKRADKNELLSYFNLNKLYIRGQQLSVYSDKNIINGYIYRNDRMEQRDAVVVFCHGMGPGHIAYTKEIAYFCNLGYPVLALDSKGCNLSEGKNLGGMYEGVNTAVTAIGCARAEFPDKKIYVIGHSWGAYSALCASGLCKVDKVVAISSPDTPVKTLFYGAAKFIPKRLAALLVPFWKFIGFVKFGKRGNMSAVENAGKKGAQVLLIHGDNDTVVNKENAAYYGVYKENVTKYLSEGKAHNPYNTVAAEHKLKELYAALSAVGKKNGKSEEFFRNFDYDAAIEEDEIVMNVIAQFLENKV